MVSEMQLQQDGTLVADGVELSVTAATWTRELEPAEVTKFGKYLGACDGAVHWWIGDTLRHLNVEAGKHGRYDKALESWPFEKGTLKNDRWVAEAFAKVSRRRDALSFKHHVEVAKFPPHDQDRWLDLAENNKWSAGKLRTEIRRAAFADAPPLPPGKYRVIYADPPWEYGNSGMDQYGPAERHYPTMSIDDLCEMDVKSLAADDAVLFMWVTSPIFVESVPLIEAWGFEFKATFIWDKVRHNYGHYNSVRHEFLLICTRGSCLPETDKLHDSVIEIERDDKHSEKPEYFRKLIEEMYPSGSRIELFARTRADGWQVHGNECEDAVLVPRGGSGIEVTCDGEANRR